MLGSLPVPSRPVTLFAAVGTVLVVVAFFLAGPVSLLRQRTKLRSPEASMGYKPGDLRKYLTALGRKDLPIYRRQLRWDHAFLILYGVGLALAIDGTLGRALTPGVQEFRLFALTPLIAAAADLVEDQLLLRIFPNTSTKPLMLRNVCSVPYAAAATLVKWVAAGTSLLALAIGAVALALGGEGAL